MARSNLIRERPDPPRSTFRVLIFEYTPLADIYQDLLKIFLLFLEMSIPELDYPFFEDGKRS
jgi:hypothetical protein